MPKLTLTDLANLDNEATVVAAINNNNTAIETALENTLSRNGTSPNAMGASLDMNANRILNLPVAISATEPVRLSEVSALITSNITTGSDSLIYAASYGLKVNDSTFDNSFALALIKAAIGTGGKKVVFPAGRIYFSSTWDISSLQNVIFEGTGGLDINAFIYGTQLIYKGTGTAAAINARETKGVIFRDIGIAYFSASFTGFTIDMSSATSSWNKNLFENVVFNEAFNTTYTAKAHVLLYNNVETTFEKCRFSGAACAVMGSEPGTTVTFSSGGVATDITCSWTNHGMIVGERWSPTTTGFLPSGMFDSTQYYVIASGFTANSFKFSLTPGGSALQETAGPAQSGVHTGSKLSLNTGVTKFRDCDFGFNTQAIVNPGVAWLFEGCNFELSQTGTPSGTYTTGPNIVEGLTYLGCSMTDATAAGTWIDIGDVYGLTWIGGVIGGNVNALNVDAVKLGRFFVSGVNITGVDFAICRDAITFRASSVGVIVEGNTFPGTTNPVVGTAFLDPSTCRYAANSPVIASNLSTLNALTGSGTLALNATNQVVTRPLLIDSLGNLVPGGEANATTATSPFIYIESCPGTPTGVPVAYTGRVATVYDSTNNRLYIYNGAWRSVLLA